MADPFLQKRFDEKTEKLHTPCPHSSVTGIHTYVVVKKGYCYRSETCMVIQCKYNRLQHDVGCLLSITW